MGERTKRALLALGMAMVLAPGVGEAVGAPGPTVRIDSGPLTGEADGNLLTFKGVPYAAAPIGALRWAPPRPPTPWTAPRPARDYGAICPQPINADGSPNAGGAAGATSEDCLFLNVWAPKAAKRAPVMVWLHGGGNTLGAGSLGAYDGSAFVRDGVILVTLNYRLGALGFFAHPALTRAASPGEPLVAYGVMDQIAALEWVKRNIAAFGGDPANVTLFGESAGGEDALILMASPLARGLFAKVIVESGGGWSPPVTLGERERQGETLIAKAGAAKDATLAQLRALPVAALTGKSESLEFGPAVDGRLLPESVSQAFAAGHAAPAPLIIGTNSFEASLMASFKVPPARHSGGCAGDRESGLRQHPRRHRQGPGDLHRLLHGRSGPLDRRQGRRPGPPLPFRLCGRHVARHGARRGSRHGDPVRLRQLGPPGRLGEIPQAHRSGSRHDRPRPRLLGCVRQVRRRGLRRRVAGL